MYKNGSYRAKSGKKTTNPEFSFISCLCILFNGFKRFWGARRLLNTIRTHLDTAGAGLTLPNIEKPQYSCFWECQCIRNDPQNLPCCPGPPQNTFILFSSIFQHHNSFKNKNRDRLIPNCQTTVSRKSTWIFQVH